MLLIFFFFFFSTWYNLSQNMFSQKLRFLRRFNFFDGSVRRDQVTIAVHVVDSSIRRPEFGLMTQSAGKTASCLEYGLSHSPAMDAAVCGALVKRLFSLSAAPDSMSAISLRIAIIALQNLSNSCLDSDSVGSIMSVPETGTTWSASGSRNPSISSRCLRLQRQRCPSTDACPR